MPAFQLRFEDASRTLRTKLEASSEYDGLLETWKACRKVANHLENGERLENLAKRLGYLFSSNRQKPIALRKDKDEKLTQKSAKKPHSSVARASMQKNSESRSATSLGLSSVPGSAPVVGLWKRPSIRSKRIALELRFREQRIISFFIPSSTSTDACKPIIRLPLDPFLGQSRNYVHGPRHEDSNEPYEPKDPSELYILPDPAKTFYPPGLHSIADQVDDYCDASSTPRATSPVLFVNPFASHAEGHSLLTPPPTPPIHSIPPHLREGAGDTSNLEPTDLTGQIKKLQDCPIALGGASDIYYGLWDLPVSKKVAVKVLRATNLSCVSAVQRRLRREMSLWWMCRHRNIVPLFGYVTDFSSLDALVSPWMKQGSVTAYLRAKKCPWSERLKLLGDVVAGLKYLHHFEPPIIHGDLKPANVLIADNGDACLCDFGLARVIKHHSGPSGFTTSNFAGSVRYMAPELFGDDDENGPPRVNTQTDIYALGCVGLEIFTDKMPYANRMMDSQVMYDIIRGMLPARQPSRMILAANPSLDNFWILIMATWKAEPDQRPNVLTVGKMLAECEIHRGPPLVADLARTSSGLLRTSTSGLARSRTHPRTRIQSAEYTYHAALSNSTAFPEHRSSIPGPVTPAITLTRSRSVGAGTYRKPGSTLPTPLGPIGEDSTSHEKTTIFHPLVKLKRSTGSILKASVGLGLGTKTQPSRSFRSSLSAVEQVWHDT